jgi:hypothetical protein
MKRVYLLLRNNIESGPYTLEELIRQRLRPSDLVWVEGTSHVWSYPSEIDELKKYVPKAEKPSLNPKRAAATYFSDEIEQKAEELRHKVMSFVPKYYSQKTVESSEPVNDSLRDIEKEEIEFTDHRKKDVALYEMFSAMAVTLFVAVSVYGGYILFTTKTMNQAVVASKAVSIDSHTAKSNTRPRSQPTVTVLDTTMTLPTSDSMHNQLVDSLAELKKTPKKVIKTDTAVKKQAPLLALDSARTNDSLSQSVAQASVEVPEKKDTVQTQAKDSVAAPEKKRSFGQVLKGLFKKKKKAEKPEEQQDTSFNGQ